MDWDAFLNLKVYHSIIIPKDAEMVFLQSLPFVDLVSAVALKIPVVETQF